MIATCIHCSRTVNPVTSVSSVIPPGIAGGIGFTFAPWLNCAKFCNTIDIPIALISGASRKLPRNGL